MVKTLWQEMENASKAKQQLLDQQLENAKQQLEKQQLEKAMPMCSSSLRSIRTPVSRNSTRAGSPPLFSMDVSLLRKTFL